MGLGNPGPEYAHTRHNAGFRLADQLAHHWGLPSFVRRGNLRETGGSRYDHDVRLLKPLTYMNRSGAVLAPFRNDPDFEAARDLLVLVDDVALPVGRFRLRARGSAGGHNGLKSLEGALRSQEFARLRIGVGPLPPDVEELADFVLEEFTRDEESALTDLLPQMTDAVECWCDEGIDEAMNQFNR